MNNGNLVKTYAYDGAKAFVIDIMKRAGDFSAIANGGNLYHPYLVKDIFNNEGEVKFQL